jgi:hypothetical protein
MFVPFSFINLIKINKHIVQLSNNFESLFREDENGFYIV